MKITPDQIRAARALLRLEQSELARRAGVSVVTIRRVEAPVSNERVAAATFDSVHAALEQAGAEFISDGVRKRSSRRPDEQALYDDLRAISLRSAAALHGKDILTDADLYNEDGVPAWSSLIARLSSRFCAVSRRLICICASLQSLEPAWYRQSACSRQAWCWLAAPATNQAGRASMP